MCCVLIGGVRVAPCARCPSGPRSLLAAICDALEVPLSAVLSEVSLRAAEVEAVAVALDGLPVSGTSGVSASAA